MTPSDPLARLLAEIPPDAARDASIRIDDLRRTKRAGRVLVVEVDAQGVVHATVERLYTLTRAGT